MTKRELLRKQGVLLFGPIVPSTFVDNGCSVPLLPKHWGDGWWGWMCRIHDYEYAGTRELEYKSQEWRDARLRADINLRLNIIRVTPGWKKFFIRPLAWVYFLAVRIGGKRAAKGA